MADDRSETPGSLQGRVALVTGAGSGIGRATALMMARRGARVAATDLDESSARATVEQMTAAGGEGLALTLDVASESDWARSTKRVEEDWAIPDVLVNCAGISSIGTIAETSFEDWRKVLAVNLDGVFLGTRAGIRAMRRKGRGCIINVSSVSGIKAAPSGSAYGTSKAGVIYLTRAAALECATEGLHIRINAVAPGGVKTPMWKTTPLWPDLSESAEWNAPPEAVPLRRFAEPEEIAQAIVFLASDDSSYVSGSVLVIDGGYSA